MVNFGLFRCKFWFFEVADKVEGWYFLFWIQFLCALMKSHPGRFDEQGLELSLLALVEIIVPGRELFTVIISKKHRAGRIWRKSDVWTLCFLIKTKGFVLCSVATIINEMIRCYCWLLQKTRCNIDKSVSSRSSLHGSHVLEVGDGTAPSGSN